MIKNRAFTFIELLISLGIVTLIAGGVIVAMSRGASNVHRGSFNAQAANQAAWIVTMMRNDIARSDTSKIVFKPESGDTWKGKTEFKIGLPDKKHVLYSVETRGDGKAFARTSSDGRKQFLASEYIADLSIKRHNDGFDINMLLKDPGKKANDFTWSARIYPPVPAGVDRYWKPLPGGKK
ncbi:MAG TPA: prepilin-type N-terminal cleavage/methylation domain-containing protein [Candidatus Rifleibacterium sp.]|nr:prepilin-type N-terminal cleavage/methylation domain-containing protein [Candidatus Rifleibacterium sp.]HPT47814.1 prepilin-type N-terminal cleavage/methylation domain-containing protein [Candidatus Rifleibacterium sp.]